MNRFIKHLLIFFSILPMIQCDLLESLDTSDHVDQAKALGLINRYRTQSCNCGKEHREAVPAVKWNDLLARMAQAHSEEMRRRGDLSHTSANGDDVGTRLAKCGYEGVAAENIAQGSKTEEDAIKQWMNSPGHCKNIMNGKLIEIGLGRSGAYWTLLLACPKDKGTSNHTNRTNDIDQAKTLALINLYRSKSCNCGKEPRKAVPAIKWNILLARVAQAHSEEMNQRSNLSHISANGDKMGTRLTKGGYQWKIAAENIAMGINTEEAAIELWMKSPGHCKNIMNGDVIEIGLGRSGTYWTLLLASPQ